MTADLQHPVIWTIGHSNREAAEFVALLSTHAIRLVADVRRFPGSRRLPQFNRENLEAALREAGVGYRHFEDLGGRRSRRLPDSPNTAWRVESFNAYADHMQTPEFQAALRDLESAAAEQPTAIMCAEALPWRCHRRLIADALVARGWKVLDILSAAAPKERTLTDFARVDGDEVTYPGGTLF
jgi:uncharacterized protein (DUF488 family)